MQLSKAPSEIVENSLLKFKSSISIMQIDPFEVKWFILYLYDALYWSLISHLYNGNITSIWKKIAKYKKITYQLDNYYLEIGATKWKSEKTLLIGYHNGNESEMCVENINTALLSKSIDPITIEEYWKIFKKIQNTESLIGLYNRVKKGDTTYTVFKKSVTELVAMRNEIIHNGQGYESWYTHMINFENTPEDCLHLIEKIHKLNSNKTNINRIKNIIDEIKLLKHP